jgi:AcrR family transcriptional regulator
MSPRAYDRKLRVAAADEAKRRIVEAAAALHATQGALATGHAQIAERAGVSIPTVYKYFPTRNDLIPACTGLVASRAPVALDGRIFDGLPRVPDRVRALARALFRLHDYFAPWLRWSEADAAAFPALRVFLEQGRQGRRRLVRKALHAPGGPAPDKALVLLADVLLDVPSWRTLTGDGMNGDAAAMVAADAIVRLERKSHEHAH